MDKKNSIGKTQFNTNEQKKREKKKKQRHQQQRQGYQEQQVNMQISKSITLNCGQAEFTKGTTKSEFLYHGETTISEVLGLFKKPRLCRGRRILGRSVCSSCAFVFAVTFVGKAIADALRLFELCRLLHRFGVAFKKEPAQQQIRVRNSDFISNCQIQVPNYNWIHLTISNTNVTFTTGVANF